MDGEDMLNYEKEITPRKIPDQKQVSRAILTSAFGPGVRWDETGAYVYRGIVEPTPKKGGNLERDLLSHGPYHILNKQQRPDALICPGSYEELCGLLQENNLTAEEILHRLRNRDIVFNWRSAEGILNSAASFRVLNDVPKESRLELLANIASTIWTTKAGCSGLVKENDVIKISWQDYLFPEPTPLEIPSLGKAYMIWGAAGYTGWEQFSHSDFYAIGLQMDLAAPEHSEKSSYA